MMKLEDISACQAFTQNKLGKITFIRYSLSLYRQNHHEFEEILAEIYHWLQALQVTEILSVVASKPKNETLYIITAEFENNVLINLFLDFTRTTSGFSKKTEIAGTEGLFVFDSATESAFQSDFLEEANWQTSLTNQEEAKTFIQLIKKSMATNEIIFKKEVPTI